MSWQGKTSQYSQLTGSTSGGTPTIFQGTYDVVVIQYRTGACTTVTLAQSPTFKYRYALSKVSAPSPRQHRSRRVRIRSASLPVGADGGGDGEDSTLGGLKAAWLPSRSIDLPAGAHREGRLLSRVPL